MSMSLRDQLLAAGLVSQKQVRDAERQQQHQQREQQHAKQKQRPAHDQRGGTSKPGQAVPVDGRRADVAAAVTAPTPATRHASAQSAKVARDLALNKKQRDKAEQKARAAQIKQLIAQNRVARGETEERYNFVDGGRVRFIAANADIRRRLLAGELVIVRHDGVHDVVPAAIAQRIRERDERAVINAVPSAAAPTAPIDDPYKDFAVPDDLMW